MNSSLQIISSASPPGGERYLRQTAQAGWDQAALRRLRVAVLGAGALGNEVLKNLALVGVGHILVVDLDRVEMSNLTRSILFREADAGQPKALVAAQRVRAINPDVGVQALVGDLHLTVGPGLLARYDLALCCLDSLDARLGLNALCLRAGIPWWNGGLGPDACEVTGFDPSQPGGPCFGCTLTDAALARAARRWSCSEGRPLPEQAGIQPTTAISASLGGALLVHQALAAIMPNWSSPGGQGCQRHLLQLKNHRLTSSSVPRNPACLACGQPPWKEAVRRISSPLTRAASGCELLAALDLDPRRVELVLEHDLVLGWRCGCPGGQQPGIPMRSLPALCQKCQERPVDLDVTGSLPGPHPLVKRPLSQLGVGLGGELCLTQGDQITLVRLALEPQWEPPPRSPQT